MKPDEIVGVPRPLPDRHRAPAFPRLRRPTHEDLEYVREIAAFRLDRPRTFGRSDGDDDRPKAS